MKKLNLFLVLISTLIFFSCGSDDDSSPEISNSTLLIGKWEATNIIIGDETLETNDCELNSTLEFKSDQTFEEQTYGGFTGGPCSPDPLISGNWSISGSTLTQILNGETFIIRILDLTENVLKYEFDDEDELQDGTVVPFTEEWTFERVND